MTIRHDDAIWSSVMIDCKEYENTRQMIIMIMVIIMILNMVMMMAIIATSPGYR